MSALIVVGLLFAVLFTLCFLTKRRFGVLGLALAAGSLLSINWTSTLTPFLQGQGIRITTPPLVTLVQAALVLAPPLVLLAGGPTYSKMHWRILGSLAFASLAFVFLLDSIGGALQLDGTGLTAYKWLLEYKSIVIVVGLVAATTDVFFTRKPKRKDEKKK